MKKTSLRILSLLICIALLIPVCACNNKDGSDDASNASASVSQFELSGDYKIVRGEYYVKSDETVKAMQLLKEAIEAVYGSSPDLCDDWQKNGEVNEYEILVGDTNRKESKEALKDLGVNDYIYSIKSQNVIVICGGTPEATLDAAKKFCENVLGYDVEAKTAKAQNVAINAGVSYTKVGTYSHIDTTINGVDIKDFTIAIKSDKYIAYAYSAAKIFAKYSGTVMPVTTYDELTGEEKGVICIGATDNQGNNKMKSGHKGYLLTSSLENGCLSVGIAASSDQFYENALNALDKNVMMSDNNTKAVLTLPKNDVCGFDYEDDIPNWYLKAEKKENVGNGVVYTEQTYVDDENKPYKVYVLTVDPKKASFHMGSSNDGYRFTLSSSERQTTQDHMKAAVAGGIKVIAGVNADFFAINSDYHPSGLAIKNGTVISKGDAGRPYIAFTKDGSAVIGASGVGADTSNLVTAVGASHIIVKDGLPKDLDMDSDFGYTSHPRTLAGVKADGTIVLAVVDGRQPNVSNGAPLARCASLMISLGAENAVNLDGGGSSTMITRSGNLYTTRNSPSDGGLRKVYNSLLVVGK